VSCFRTVLVVHVIYSLCGAEWSEVECGVGPVIRTCRPLRPCFVGLLFARAIRVSFHFDITINPSLLPWIIVGNVCIKPNSENKFLSHLASHAASDKAIYSTSVVDMAVMDCFLENQVIALPAMMKTYLVINFQIICVCEAGISITEEVIGMTKYVIICYAICSCS